jgi:hypothetical protein
MISSTQRQVAALVAGSVLLAFVLNIFLLFVIRSLGDAPEHFPDHAALRIVAAFYAARPELRPELLRQAAAAGMVLREIPDSTVRACTAAKPQPPCPPGGFDSFMPRVRS